MKTNKLLFSGLLLLVSCTEINANHCAADVSKCAKESMVCNDVTGQCEAPPTSPPTSPPPPVATPAALSVTDISPPVLPVAVSTTTDFTVTGTGFLDNKITGLAIENKLVNVLSVDNSSVKFRFKNISDANFSKCGPLSIVLIDSSGKNIPAAEELFGRGFHKWKYQAAYPGHTPKNLIRNFSINTGFVDGLEYVYDDKKEAKVYNSNAAKTIIISSTDPVAAGDYRNIVFSNPTLLQNAAGERFAVHNRGENLVQNKIILQPGNPLEATTPACAGMSFVLTDYKTTLSTTGPNQGSYVVALCAKPGGMPNTANIQVRTLGYLNLEQQATYYGDDVDYLGVALSYPQAPSLCGGLLVKAIGTLGLPMPPDGFGIMTVCRPNNNFDVSEKLPITGTNPAVFSVKKADDPAAVSVLHYVATRVGGQIRVQVIEATRANTAKPVQNSKATVAMDVTWPISAVEKVLNIEVYDLNCDDFPDLIIRAGQRIVAYLGTGDMTWDTNNPKELFSIPADQSTQITKNELLPPNFKTANKLSVMGILDSLYGLQMYQQE